MENAGEAGNNPLESLCVFIGMFGRIITKFNQEVPIDPDIIADLLDDGREVNVSHMMKLGGEMKGLNSLLIGNLSCVIEVLEEASERMENALTNVTDDPEEPYAQEVMSYLERFPVAKGDEASVSQVIRHLNWLRDGLVVMRDKATELKPLARAQRVVQPILEGVEYDYESWMSYDGLAETVGSALSTISYIMELMQSAVTLTEDSDGTNSKQDLVT